MPRFVIKDIAGDSFLCLEVTRFGGERAVTFSSQSSRDLVTWTANTTIQGEETLNPDGSITTLFRYPEPIGATQGKPGFLRLYISD